METIVKLEETALEKLQKIGVNINNSNQDVIIAWLKRKHWYKYQKLIKFLRFYKISTTWSNLQLIYKIDIELRRIIDKFLKGYEEDLESAIMYLSEKHNWNSKSDDFYNIDKANWTNFERNLRQKKSRSLVFVEKSLKKIFKKLKSNCWLDVIEQLNFSQKNAIFSILSDHLFWSCFYEKKTNETRGTIENHLQRILKMRNLIAHVNILLTIKPFFSDLKIFDIIFAMNQMLDDSFQESLSNQIQKYKLELQKLNKTHENDLVIDKIFKGIGKELFNE